MTADDTPGPTRETKDVAERTELPERTPQALVLAAEAAEAEAEAEAAEVEARAAAARARATRLRRQVEAASVGDQSDDDNAIGDSANAGTRSRRWRLRRPTFKDLAVAAAIMLICASLGVSGYFVWHDRLAAQKRQRTADFAAAARADAAALMSLDFNNSKENMRHIDENSTGTFKQHFPVIADQLTRSLQRSKIISTVTVNDVAVESMTDNSATVLVAATTQANEPDGPQDVRTWHVVLGLQLDGGRPKMSNVEFVQ
jgi:Mce-associated membrane protein